MIEEVRKMLANCSLDERQALYEELRQSVNLHPFEVRMNVRADVILEALNRAGELTLRGIRGVIGEATFVLEIIPLLSEWESLPVIGDLPYDALLRDSVSSVSVQVKMQRRVKGEAWIRKGLPIVEVQRTRGGKRKGENTRPYRFGEFDILAVCMEPSHKRWNSFLYIPQRWLHPRANANLVEIMQPVALEPNEIWTNDFDEAVVRLRSGKKRPAD